MQDRIRLLLAELKTCLADMYGSRLKEVCLYGSYARGEQHSESDLDVLIILDSVDDYGLEIDRTSHLISGLSLGLHIGRTLLLLRVFKPTNEVFPTFEFLNTTGWDFGRMDVQLSSRYQQRAFR